MSDFPRKLRKILVLAAMVCSLASMAKMTDQQVIEYIRRQSAIGKTEQQIGKELLAKGVTPEQIQRLRSQYETEYDADGKPIASGSKKQTAPGTRLSGTRADRLRQRTEPTDDERLVITDIFDVMEPDSMRTLLATDTVARKRIFGHDMFTGKSLSFEPNENMATPANYRLGPGDEVIIDIWGASEDQIRETISPEGSIIVEQIGPMHLNGLTVDEANERIRSIFAQKYAGVAEGETDVALSLGQIRSILVNVMGEVTMPGSYRLSPFSTVFNALYRAGGINDIGSMRRVSVLRDGRRLTDIDIYDFLFGGKTGTDIRLQEGDVIIVPPYEELISVEGGVKRPMYYELREGETLDKLLSYTGGFAGDGYADLVSVSRRNGTENEIYNVGGPQFRTYVLQDGDIVTVGATNTRFTNRVELRGAAKRPGFYAIDSTTPTVRSLLKLAQGLADDAYTQRAFIYRQGEGDQLQGVGFNLADVLEGRAADIELKPNDIIVISATSEVLDPTEVTIYGMVNAPGDYPFADGMTVDDLIFTAGGLQVGASEARVDVSRRIIDPMSLKPTEQTAEVFTFALKNGIAVNADPEFRLKAYDIVNIRRSPGYQTQREVTVTGEVAFEGRYTLQKRNERISDIIRRAGGTVPGAYLRGARLMRQMTKEEIMNRNEMVRLTAQQSGDSISLDMTQFSDQYSVGINLESALQKPGSYDDLVLMEGDELIIPEEITTVKISGDVMYPNVVGFVPGKKLKYYIDQAGGYGERARKNKVFIVYANGTVARGKRGTIIEPGCQIVVPSKPKNGGTNWAQVISYVSSFASLGTMAATIYSIFKK